MSLEELRNQRGKLEPYQFRKIISQMSEEEVTELIQDVDLVSNGFHLEDYAITDLIIAQKDDELKAKLISEYKLSNYYKGLVIETLGNKKKTELILNNKKYLPYEILGFLKTFEPEELMAFLTEHKEFCKSKGIKPYEAVNVLSVESQIKVAMGIQDFNLTKREKLEIFATLSDEAKEKLEKEDFEEDLKRALSFKCKKYSARPEIKIDFSRNLSDYQGIDRTMSLDPESLSDEQRKKAIELCRICPEMEIIDTYENIGYFSTGKEYVDAEEWISSLIESLPKDYSDAQKLALIDNAIGKKISYSPEFETEVFDTQGSRALSKIVSTGYGVCNGIANVEKHILDRIGIESEIVSSGNHAFLKLNNIELPLENGEVVKGNTILDPTWNLMLHRFGGKPSHFLINYEQARASDIDSEGKDRECHKNDEELKDATLSLDTPSLRKLFASVGLADKDGNFPVKATVELSEAIHQAFANDPSENINRQFLLLAKVCPEFAKAQNESMKFLSNILLSNENLQYNRCVVNRVYDRTDENRKPVMYVYIDSNELGKKFYFADKEEGKFVELSPEEFTKRFECYDRDLKKAKGIRPWEAQEQDKEDELTQTTYEIARQGEGQER